MKRCFQTEWWRMMHSAGLWASLALGLGIALSGYIEHVWLPFHNPQMLAEEMGFGGQVIVFNNLLCSRVTTAQTFLYYFLLPMIAVLPSGVSFASDRSTGALRQILANTGSRKHYFTAKAAVTFLSGGLCVLIPMVVDLLLVSVTVPTDLPIASCGRFTMWVGQLWVELFYTHPWVYLLLYFALVFVFAGLIAQTALCVGMYVRNRLAVTFSPLLLYLLVDNLLDLFGCGELSPYSFLRPGIYNIAAGFGVIALQAVILAAVVAFVFIRKGCRDDVL